MGNNKRKKNKLEMKYQLYITAFIITLFLFLTIFGIGTFLNQGREKYIDNQFTDMNNEFISMQTFFMLSDAYDNEMACLAFQNKLVELDASIWNLGEKIDKYRAASEEFKKDPYYKKQKIVFNENQVFYYLLLKKMIDQCDLDKEIILYFYRNSEDCKKCDDQSFILSDINEEDDDLNQEIAIFSYDLDLNITTINLLAQYHEAYELPCLIIGNKTMCKIQDKNTIMKEICQKQNFTICDELLD